MDVANTLPCLRRMRTSFAASRARWAWLASLCLFAGAGVGEFEVQALRAQQALLTGQLASQARELKQVEFRFSPPRRESVLPSVSQLSRVTADLQEIALKQGLSVVDVTYTPAPMDASHKIERIDISARMTGTYAQAKNMLSALLGLYDNLGLVGVTFRRSTSGSSVLECELLFALFYRAGDA